MSSGKARAVHEWQLRRAALQPGIAKLKFGFGLPPSLPLRRHILHPLLQQQCHLFCGELEPLAIRDSLG